MAGFPKAFCRTAKPYIGFKTSFPSAAKQQKTLFRLLNDNYFLFFELA